MEDKKVIDLIAGRIMDEYRKHPTLDWAKIAAIKIHDQWIEYFENYGTKPKDELTIKNK